MGLNLLPIDGYNGRYSVSDCGCVVSHNSGLGMYAGKGDVVLRGNCNEFGYRQVYLYKDSKVKCARIHRLVCRAFNGEQPAGKRCVNHKDGNKLNNRADNLEWVSHSENMQHAIDTGLRRGWYPRKNKAVQAC